MFIALQYINIQDPTTNNASDCTFLIGQEFDRFSGKSGALLQGRNPKN